MENQRNNELMEQCMELAKLGIDLEKLFDDLEPLFEIVKQVIDLGIKNYNYLIKHTKDN